MYKVVNHRQGLIGCSCVRKGKADVLLLQSGSNEVTNDLWEQILKGNPERYEALSDSNALSWRKVPSKSASKAEAGE